MTLAMRTTRGFTFTNSLVMKIALRASIPIGERHPTAEYFFKARRLSPRWQIAPGAGGFHGVHEAALASPYTLDQLPATWLSADGDAEAGQSLPGRLPDGVCLEGGPSQLIQDQVQTAKVECLRLSKFEQILAPAVPSQPK